MILKTPEKPRRRLTRPPKRPAPAWLKHIRTILAVATPLLGAMLLMWRLQPDSPFHPPPSTVEVIHVRMADQDGLPVLQGDVSNKSGRLARKLTFRVEYRVDGVSQSSFVVVQNVPNEATVPFSVPLVISQPGDKSVIQPGKAPQLNDTPRFVPYDSVW